MFTELYGLPMIWNTIACLLVNECSWTKLQTEQITHAHTRALFQRLMKNPKFDGIPMILETPCVSDNAYKKKI